jgi:transposase
MLRLRRTSIAFNTWFRSGNELCSYSIYIMKFWAYNRGSDVCSLVILFKDASKWYGWETDTTQRPSADRGFVPEKNRWQIERTFGWQNFSRRLSVDYERTTDSSESMISLAVISIILARMT